MENTHGRRVRVQTYVNLPCNAICNVYMYLYILFLSIK